MSNYQHKPESGSLFKNKEKTEDTHSDYRGSCLIDGKEYFMNCWINESQKGTKYMSVKFKLIDESYKQGKPKVEAAANPQDNFQEDSIPF